MADPAAVRRGQPAPDPTAQRVVIRTICAVTWALALGVAILGYASGYEISRGGAVVQELEVSRAPHLLTVLLGGLSALGAYVWRRPVIARALLWSLLSIGVAVFILALTAVPAVGPGDHALVQPAVAAAGRLVLALVLVQIAVLPLACGLLALAARAARPERIARARVHRLAR